MIVRFKDLPADPKMPFGEHEASKIMHIVLPTGEGSVLTGNDVPEAMGKTNERENRSKILVGAKSKDEANKLFNGLSEGGEVEVPMADSPWGSYFGMFRDKYGIEWMIDFSEHHKGEVKH